MSETALPPYLPLDFLISEVSWAWVRGELGCAEHRRTHTYMNSSLPRGIRFQHGENQEAAIEFFEPYPSARQIERDVLMWAEAVHSRGGRGAAPAKEE